METLYSAEANERGRIGYSHTYLFLNCITKLKKVNHVQSEIIDFLIQVELFVT